MKILIVAHSFSPIRGSEPGIAWNTAWHVAEHHPVRVITHPQYRDEIEPFLAQNPRDNLHIEYLDLPAKWNPWNPQRGERGLKLHYLLWQRAVARRATELVESQQIDLVHHVSFGTINAAPRLYKLPVPLVWGPLGGGEVMPLKFHRYFAGSRKAEYARYLASLALPLNPSLRRMARRSVCLVSNLETRRILERAGARHIEMAIDCGLPDGYAADATPQRPHRAAPLLLWAGRLEPRKALPLALEALARTEVKARLVVAGEGPLAAQWQAQSATLGLSERVEFLGGVKWQKMSELFRTADAFVFTSLRDRFGTVVLEAMGHALPILTLDHNGVRCFVPDDAGVKVAVDEPQRTIDELARAFELIARDPQRRERMGAAALEYARTRTWSERARELLDIYQRIHTAAPNAATPQDPPAITAHSR